MDWAALFSIVPRIVQTRRSQVASVCTEHPGDRPFKEVGEDLRWVLADRDLVKMSQEQRMLIR